LARTRVLETPRLTIEPFSEARLTERYVSWLNDRETMRYSENRQRTHTLQSCREYAGSFEDTPHYFWAIVARDHALGHIGNINAYVEPAHGVADVGIVVGERASWGRGYGTEAWVGVCDFLLRTAGIRKVSAGAVAVNRAMIAIMRRAGMQPDGIRAAHQIIEGEAVDVVHAALFREAWLRRFPRGPFETHRAPAS
jgi:[ribosomal protein S5]-alanine N-acetyltransferase